jgi:hypothetical protein
MNKVDIYVNGFRLDIFDDEEITINLSVQNVQDISKVFTDFTQGFTVPASPRNNEILQHYYNSNITASQITTETGGSPVWNSIGINWNTWTTAWNAGASSTSVTNTFDGRLRQPARIEINSLPFRTGVIEIENVQLKGTEPYAYTLTFYGDVVGLSDLFGEDYLYDLSFPEEYDFDYTDDEIYDRLTTADFDPVFIPLMSPVKNWFYDSGSGSGAHADNNIAYHTGGGHGRAHGINYYELKPAIKVWAVLDAMEAKYGITFTGSFISSAPFTDLSLWLHRFEGYLFDGGSDIAWELINMNRNTGTGSQFDLATDTWTVPDDAPYDLQISIANVSENYELGIFKNGVFDGSLKFNAHPSSSVTHTFSQLYFGAGTQVQLFIRPQQPVAMNYQIADYSGIDSITATSEFSVDQTSPATYDFRLLIADIMPEIKVKDFLAGIMKMHNLVIVPNSSTSFLLQPLDDWYAAGVDQDYQTYLDITEYSVNRPPIYREIEFKYQETEQILGYQFQRLNNTGFGDLRAFFNFDADEFIVQVPFECPLFERLTDLDDGSLTNVLVYKSITSEVNEDGTYNPYLGAPILFYGQYLSGAYDISANAVSFVDADGTTERPVTELWFADTSNSLGGVTNAQSICFGQDIDPYQLISITNSLYNSYWSDYITDLYAKSRRVIQVDAVLPIGKIITMNLKNAIIWNNAKYIVNNVNLNMTTGRARFELLNVV